MECAAPRPDWLAYITGRLEIAPPGRSRASAALLADPRRSNRAIAAAAATDHMTVMAARHDLEAAHLIPPWRSGRQQRGPVLGRRVRIASALLTDPRRSNRVIAGLYGESHTLVMTVRRLLESAGLIETWRAEFTRWVK